MHKAHANQTNQLQLLALYKTCLSKDRAEP